MLQYPMKGVCMKRSAFISLFFGTHLLFIIVQIHKHTLITKFSYQEGKLGAEKQQWINKKRSLNNQWLMITDRSAVKDFVEQQLHLQPLSLSQIKKIHYDKQNV